MKNIKDSMKKMIDNQDYQKIKKERKIEKETKVHITNFKNKYEKNLQLDNQTTKLINENFNLAKSFQEVKNMEENYDELAVELENYILETEEEDYSILADMFERVFLKLETEEIKKFNLAIKDKKIITKTLQSVILKKH